MKKTLLVLALLFAALGGIYWMVTPHKSGELSVTDGFLRKNSPKATAAAAYFTFDNSGPTDRLIGVEVDFARMSVLHTNIENADGVMMMRPLENGIEIPSGEITTMGRGGDHVMLMGLTGSFEDGEVKSLDLIFEKAGRVTVMFPVDQSR